VSVCKPFVSSELMALMKLIRIIHYQVHLTRSVDPVATLGGGGGVGVGEGAKSWSVGVARGCSGCRCPPPRARNNILAVAAPTQQRI